MHCVNELYCIFIISFFYLHAFHKPNNIITKPSIKVTLIFKVSQTKRQIDIPLWTHMGHKEWSEDGKTFTKCYTIASKFWDEFNANFVLLHFSSYRSIKIWHIYFRYVEKKAGRPCIKTPKHLLQDFYIVSDHFGTLCIKGLRNVLPWYLSM